MEPITTVAASGLSSIAEMGVAGVFLMLLLVGGIFILRWFMNEFKACHENTARGLDNSTEALNGVKIVLAEIKAKLEK